MKKTACVILILSMILSVFPAGLAASYDRSGTFYAPITAAFCSGQPDRYSFWTQSEDQAALLAVLIAQDMARENYTDYNYCFPVDYLSCVTFNRGEHADRDIHVIYMCFDAYLITYYDADSGMVSYWIDKQIPETDDFVRNYVNNVNGGYHQYVFWNMDYTMDFPEGTAAFSSAMRKWNSYLEQHPELIDTSHIGY